MTMCKTCCFSEPDSNVSGKLVCMRYPPVPAFIVQPHPISGQPMPGMVTMRPQVDPGQYCGEYVSDLEDNDKPTGSAIQ